MVFDILIRMKINRAEYIEYPIVPVFEQPSHGTHEALQSGRGDPCCRPCCPATTIALGIVFQIIIFWGHPNPRARGIRPLHIPGCCSRAVVGIAIPGFTP